MDGKGVVCGEVLRSETLMGVKFLPLTCSLSDTLGPRGRNVLAPLTSFLPVCSPPGPLSYIGASQPVLGVCSVASQGLASLCDAEYPLASDICSRLLFPALRGLGVDRGWQAPPWPPHPGPPLRRSAIKGRWRKVSEVTAQAAADRFIAHGSG